MSPTAPKNQKSSGLGKSELSKEQREEALRRLTIANIPLRLRKAKRADFSYKADILYSYMDSAIWAQDRADGKAICLSGNPALRTDLFQLIAKGFALAGRSTYFVTLHQFLFMLEDDERRRKLERVDNLFLADFEKDFGPGGCPYTYYQRASVEDFLSARKGEEKKATFFSTAKAWASGEWWSRDFVSEYTPRVIDIQLPN